MEKAEALNHFFTLLFTSKSSSHTTQVTEGRDWENEKPYTVRNQERQILNNLKRPPILKNLKVHKSIESDERHAGPEGTWQVKWLSHYPQKKNKL